MPPTVILGFQNVLYEAVRDRADETIRLVGIPEVHLLDETVGFVGDLDIGAPVAGS